MIQIMLVLAYITITIGIGIKTKRKMNSSKTFDGAGLGLLMCVAAGAGEWLGGTATTGVAEYGYLYGLSGVANGLGICFLAIFFLPNYFGVSIFLQFPASLGNIWVKRQKWLPPRF